MPLKYVRLKRTTATSNNKCSRKKAQHNSNQIETLRWGAEYNIASVQSKNSLLNKQVGITLRLPQRAGTCTDTTTNWCWSDPQTKYVTYVDSGFFTNILVCKFYQPPTCNPNNSGRSYKMRTSLLLGRYECRWPPSWLRSSEKLCRKVSFSTPCDVAASGTNPWAQRQAKQHGFKFVVSKVNSMDSPNLFGICLVFFQGTGPKTFMK